MHDNTLLRVQNLTKVFKVGNIFSRLRLTAVENVSFNVGRGEIFTLAGESGCGKTTISRIVLGFETPTSGKVYYGGREITSLRHRERRELLREIQAVFQNPFSAFNPLRRVDSYFYETLRSFRLSSSEDESRRIIRDKLRAVGIEFDEFSEKYPSEFSGGQLQRISVARSLLTNPSLLIADEPVSMVDASIRMSIVNLFKDLKDNLGLSIIYITHDLATAYYVSDRVAIMFRGNIIESGPAEKVLEEPKHPYTMLLRESVPEADPSKRWKDRINLSDVEVAEYQLTGCKFAGRCRFAMEQCRSERPQDYSVDGVVVKCFLYESRRKVTNGGGAK